MQTPQTSDTSLSIPQDVIECIIAELQKDNPSLKRCALASSSLRNAAHRHLFYSITISNENLASRFHALLQYQSTIAPLVRYLRVSTGSPNPALSLPGWIVGESVRRMESILRRLAPYLCSFTFVCPAISPFFAISRSSLHSAVIGLFQAPNLIEVRLISMPYPPLHALRDCPQLKRIYLFGTAPFRDAEQEVISDRDLQQPDQADQQARGQVDSIYTDLTPGFLLLAKALTDRGSRLGFSSLRHLEIFEEEDTILALLLPWPSHWPSHMKETICLLENVAPTLESFSLRNMNLEVNSEIHRLLPVAKMRNVQSLSFIVVLGQRLGSSLAWLITAMETLATPEHPLQNFILRLGKLCSPDASFYGIDSGSSPGNDDFWSALDSVLGNSNYSKLRQVIVTFTVPMPPHPTFEPAFLRVMPVLSRKGILKVKFCEELEDPTLIMR
ncbi:hypothetical protein FPV67DRAFT_563463 [Lyophyllum atratum]|nr:hypothetical protein FPV67DRAFT_563463 [Lyophyllum atratum]